MPAVGILDGILPQNMAHFNEIWRNRGICNITNAPIIPYKYNISLNLFHLPVDGILAGAHGIQCLLPQLLERQSTQLRAALDDLT